MAWIRKSDGAHVEVPDEDVWGKPLTQAEIAERAESDLQSELEAMTERANDRDKALVFLMADLWRVAHPGMSMQEAHNAVRGRLQTHLRKLKRLD